MQSTQQNQFDMIATFIERAINMVESQADAWREDRAELLSVIKAQGEQIRDLTDVVVAALSQDQDVGDAGDLRITLDGEEY